MMVEPGFNTQYIINNNDNDNNSQEATVLSNFQCKISPTRFR